MINQLKGMIGEEYAEEYLISLGFEILERNFRAYGCEIDIIASGEGFLIFCEVKLRTSNRYGIPCESVTWRKQQNILEAAYAYLEKNPSSLQPRFDIIEIYAKKVCGDLIVEDINYIKNAFGG